MRMQQENYNLFFMNHLQVEKQQGIKSQEDQNNQYNQDNQDDQYNQDNQDNKGETPSKQPQ